MGYYCTVPQCTSLAGKTKNVKFHRFPRDVTMADKWNLILKRGKPYTKYSKVCSLHFTQADYNVTTMGQWKTLSKDAVPSQNLPKLNADGTVMVIRKSRTVKYRDGKKEDVDKPEKWTTLQHIPVSATRDDLVHNLSDKSEKWVTVQHVPVSVATRDTLPNNVTQDPNLAYRLQTLNAIANTISPQNQTQQVTNPKKQDANIQTDPQSEEEDSQPNNSYSEPSEKSYTSEQPEYTTQYKDDQFDNQKKFDTPKDYTKTQDFIPQTNEEYNKEAEKYALERKSHNGYENKVMSEVLDGVYQKAIIENGYPKIQDIYVGFDKSFLRTESYIGYQNGYQDSVEVLRNQQHNLQMLQEQHRVTENQNFFNENHIKQEVDIAMEEEKFGYEQSKEQIEQNDTYEGLLMEQQRRLLEQVKQEPDTSAACDSVIQPQTSPFYQSNGPNNVTGGYYDSISRPGPELLIAKQNALAAHTQLWQNTMKRPFFYSENPHYNGPQLLHRYEDISRILQ